MNEWIRLQARVRRTARRNCEPLKTAKQPAITCPMAGLPSCPPCVPLFDDRRHSGRL